MRLQLRASSPPEPQSHRATKHRKMCKTRSMPANGQPSLFINLVTSASQNHRTESQERKSLLLHQLLSVYEEPSNLTLTTMRPFPLVDHSSTTPANRGHLPATSRRKWQHIYSAAQSSRKNPVELCKKTTRSRLHHLALIRQLRRTEPSPRNLAQKSVITAWPSGPSGGAHLTLPQQQTTLPSAPFGQIKNHSKL
jgi:hypothetical protein